MISMRALALAFTFAEVHFAPALAQEAPRIVIARVPANSVQPRAVVDEHDVVHLVVYVGDAMSGDLDYVRTGDAGKTFSAPLRVNGEDGRAIAYGAVRGAQIALGRAGRVHIAWNGSSKEPHTAPMLYTRLDEAGAKFEAPRNVITSHYGLDGGGAIAASADGHVWVAWHAPEGKEESEAARRVFVARSADDGKTFGPEQAISPEGSGVCPCCGIAAFSSGGDALSILYRTASNGDNRHTLLVSTSAPSSSYARTDKWRTPTCVMSTFSIAQSSQGAFGAFESEGHVRFAKLEGAPPKSITVPGDSTPRKHPSIACNDKGDVLLAWIEGPSAERGGVLEWQLFDAAGAPVAGQSGKREDVPVWDLPAAVALRDGRFVLFY